MAGKNEQLVRRVKSMDSGRASMSMIVACVFIALSTLLAKGPAGRFETVAGVEGIHPLQITAAAIMLCGALILVRPGTGAFQPAAVIALVSALAGGIESTVIKRLSALEPRVQVLFINNSIGLVIALAAAWWVWRDPTLVQWLLMAAVGLTMAVAQLFFMTAMRDGEASFVMPFLYSTLVFASVLDFWIFGDRPDAAGALGALTIVGGAVFLAVRERTRHQAATRQSRPQ